MLCGEELCPINRKTYILNPSIFEENSNIPGSSFVLLPKVKKQSLKFEIICLLCVKEALLSGHRPTIVQRESNV